MRDRVVAGIHSGHLDVGDRLQSYRELAEESGLDLRAIGRIYDALEREGLVEVRGKTGVYVASQERIGGRVLAETARWTVGVLTDAWRRRIRLPDYPAFVERCIATVSLRCACIESTQDQLASLCGELTEDFGLPTTAVHADELLGLMPETSQRSAPAHVRDADVLLTTVFHAASVRPIAQALEKPLVVMKLDQDLAATVERHLAARDLVVVCVDPRFIERMRMVFQGGERIRGVLVSNKTALAQLDPQEPVLITRAARRELKNAQALPSLLPPYQRVFSPQSAMELIETIIRLNLEAMRADGDASPSHHGRD